MSLVRESAPRWQQLCFQLSLTFGLLGGIAAASYEIGAHNAVSEARYIEHELEAYEQATATVASYNHALAAPSQPLPGSGYATPRTVIASKPNNTIEPLLKNAQTDRDRGQAAFSIALLAGMCASLSIPTHRKQRLSDTLSAQWDHELIYGDPTPPIVDVSRAVFTGELDEMRVVLPEMPATTQTYIANSYYEDHPEIVTEAELSFHPIRSRERIAQQVNPDNHTYDQFRVPLIAIEQVQLDIA
jgi:hypothetical protein